MSTPRRWEVAPPLEVADVDAGFGRLDAALHWLAAAQSGWPPQLPKQRLDVVVSAGSFAAGIAAADDAADRGVDLITLGADGPPAPALAALAALLDIEPVAVVGTSGGAEWGALTVGVRDGLRAARPHLGDPEALLEALGGGALAHCTGLLAQAAVRRTPVVVDGSVTSVAAAVLADRLAAGGFAWWLAGQEPTLAAARTALGDLGLVSLVDLSLDRPEGARLAADLLLAAVQLL